MKDAITSLQAQFVVESMSGGSSFDISEYNVVLDDDINVCSIQQQAGQFALMSKQFILTDLADPNSLAGLVSSTIKQSISDGIQCGKFKKNQCMKHFLELKQLDYLSSHVTMLTMHSTLKEVEDINNIPHEIMRKLLTPDSVCLAMGFYVLTICIGNPYYSINDFNKLFAYSWCEYYHSVMVKLMMIQMNGNNWKSQFVGAMGFFDFFKSKNVSVTVNGNTNTNNQEDLNLDQEALTAYDNKNYKLAITLYSRLIERKPSAHQYYQFRGTVYEDMGDDDLAKSDFEKSIKLNPQNATSLFRLGMLYARRKDLQKAVTFLKEAYKYQPSDYKSYMGDLYNNILYVHKRVVAYNLGNYLTQIGQIAEGLKYLKEVISNCPEYSYPYFSISLVYFQKNDFQNALEYALKAQKYGHPKGLDLVNAIKMQMGNTVKDKYSKMVENSNFNPFNITTDERLQGGQPLPNLLDVFKRELESSLNNTVLLSNLGAKQIVQSYVFNLAESYYNNAGYIPKIILDQIIEQVYKALLQIDTKVFTSLDELKDAVYYSLLNN